jgi:hypothetical protein
MVATEARDPTAGDVPPAAGGCAAPRAPPHLELRRISGKVTAPPGVRPDPQPLGAPLHIAPRPELELACTWSELALHLAEVPSTPMLRCLDRISCLDHW